MPSRASRVVGVVVIKDVVTRFPHNLFGEAHGLCYIFVAGFDDGLDVSGRKPLSQRACAKLHEGRRTGVGLSYGFQDCRQDRQPAEIITMHLIQRGNNRPPGCLAETTAAIFRTGSRQRPAGPVAASCLHADDHPRAFARVGSRRRRCRCIDDDARGGTVQSFKPSHRRSDTPRESRCRACRMPEVAVAARVFVRNPALRVIARA